eukprot:gnl/Chilomastix_cuspidata/5156.p1 GENE.gnl/Chilomastix_cuspidata/5156~~gnl/Chilomastix_cuspidata/5156.p1  ORF type:complete len:200 (-),score=38.55 gnl/Chilomastix_cuspidata/5156:54-653(-)
MSSTFVDFSYYDIAGLRDLIKAPSINGHRKPPGELQPKKPGEAHPRRPPHPPTGIRLCSNQLTSLDGLQELIYAAMWAPRRLTVLDLSCNRLETLSEEIFSFSELQAVYLHQNNIASAREIVKLAQLKNLRHITCHANPLEEEQGYREFLILKIPHLRRLNFTLITKRDRDAATGAQKRGATSLRRTRPLIEQMALGLK